MQYGEIISYFIKNVPLVTLSLLPQDSLLPHLLLSLLVPLYPPRMRLFPQGRHHLNYQQARLSFSAFDNSPGER
jgi:hypothetical protein